MSRFLKVEKFNNVLIEKMEGGNSMEGGTSSNEEGSLTEPCTITLNDTCPAGFVSSDLCVIPGDNPKYTNYCAVEQPE